MSIERLDEIIENGGNVINAKDLARLAGVTSRIVAGRKMRLVKAGKVTGKAMKVPFTESVSKVSKAEFAESVKNIIRTVDVLTNEEIAIICDIPVGSVKAYRSHVGREKKEAVVVKTNKKTKVKAKKKVVQGAYPKDKLLAPKKMEARKIMVKAINKAEDSRPILSLPSDSFAMEDLLAMSGVKGAVYDFVETKAEVFANMVKTLATSNHKFVNLHLGDLSTRIKLAKANQYRDIIADYCGTIARHHAEIKTAIKKNIVKVGGTICITLSRRAKFPKSLKRFNVYKEDGKIDILKSTEKYFSSFAGYEVETVFTYADYVESGYTGNKMVLFIIRRVK